MSDTARQVDLADIHALLEGADARGLPSAQA